ncbi:DUF3973 domain-containing protein [Paenibacillus thiaminolyticus]|uniref:DUF3973 domain-containing protein n=1 Tax=Paenibacillus thiaminolyticus TaxID=49283 RepID=UPI003D26A6D6
MDGAVPVSWQQRNSQSNYGDKEVVAVFYCIVCSQLHEECGAEDWVFEHAIYIEPMLGEKIQLGMCNKKVGRGSSQYKYSRRMIKDGTAGWKKVNSDFPVYEHIDRFQLW